MRGGGRGRNTRRQGKPSDPEDHLKLYLKEAVIGHNLSAFPFSKALWDGSKGIFLAGRIWYFLIDVVQKDGWLSESLVF